ncbi:hypothetical protein M378DRAFT_159294 [Amanita muscaria Koide BX008]|uniref:Mitochondrial import inner membrane translocase subunit n=1 Tax=Amanita muscaria (strain Koide BX008) TaxID=946122 RepID=A0A0C2XDD9_AMAMK|nr:hypothetical protein M378DRAFT_159294 [Amanita muscaria Koide BX008]
MSDFLRSTTSGSTDMAARKEALMNSIRSEIALLSVQELMNKGTEKCFAKCVTKPGSSLSNSEQTCLDRCLDRYMDAFTLVSRTYIGRVSKERQEPS